MHGLMSGMLGDWKIPFPRLDDDNHVVTSPRTPRYNCIGWAAGSATRWWWPTEGYYWPSSVSHEETIEAFVQAYATLGYAVSENSALESGIEKVAIYAIRDVEGSLAPTHAARQLPDGTWTSKLGALEDIGHSHPSAVSGPAYGEPVCYRARPQKNSSERK